MATIIDYVEHWAAIQPDTCLYSFLDQYGRERERYTFQTFHERTRHLAAFLAGEAGFKSGERVLLVYPPGLELVAAFFACARIGVIPVPVYPPTPVGFQAGLTKLIFIARDCGARAALTTRGFYRSYQLLSAKRKNSLPDVIMPELPRIKWITTDNIRGFAPDSFENNPGESLFIQYTSGSTNDPKGVVVTHENVIHNSESLISAVACDMICVSWLPQYHDMGLIGYYLCPLVGGGTTYGFSPLDFLKRPALWFQTISRVRANLTASPNFGYEYCLREGKLPPEQMRDVDLSSVRVMMNAAEPVRAGTYTRFFDRFAPFGLRPEAYVVAYGLAENTLAVTLFGRQMLTVNKAQLQRHMLHIENGRPKNSNQLRILSCGKPLSGIRVRIVDPEARAVLGEKQIGEIWIAGSSRCRGYWNRPALSREVFEGRVSDDPADRDAYLRTGDLGFQFEGEIFVCGRIKDLIIIRGVNYYPQDIEAIVESSSSRIYKGGAVAFNRDDDDEALVVLAEVKSAKDMPEPVRIFRAIRTQYYVEPHTLVYVPHGAIVKTTSGKISRGQTRERWLNGEIPVLATHLSARESVPIAGASALRGRFQYLFDLYHITGREEMTFAEIGVDSLMMIQLLDDIKKLMADYGAGKLIDMVDVRLLNRLTVAGFFSLLKQFEASSVAPVSALRFWFKQIRREQEYFDRECMRSDSRLEPGRVEVMAHKEPVSNVLLTGATGFFGPFLLYSLLRETPYRYYVLTRASDPAHARDRVEAGLRRSGLWTPGLARRFDERVRVIRGDLSQHNLGLPPERWEALSMEVQAVFHNAALVNYVLDYEALRPHNVDGTRALLRFAFTGVPKVFHFVSSTFIFGWTVKNSLLETDNNARMSHLEFGYAQSKWVSEQLVLAAGRQGLTVRVYRPSMISASSGGVGSSDDIAIRLLAFMIKYGIALNAENQISFLPADIAAGTIAILFRQPPTDETTFHVTVDGYYNMADITRIITAEYGYAFTYLDIPGFIAEMNRLCTRADLLYPLMDFCNRFHRKIAAMRHKRYDNAGYRRARAASGNAPPEPGLVETVHYIMRFMLKERLIPRNPRPAPPLTTALVAHEVSGGVSGLRQKGVHD